MVHCQRYSDVYANDARTAYETNSSTPHLLQAAAKLQEDSPLYGRDRVLLDARVGVQDGQHERAVAQAVERGPEAVLLRHAPDQLGLLPGAVLLRHPPVPAERSDGNRPAGGGALESVSENGLAYTHISGFNSNELFVLCLQPLLGTSGHEGGRAAAALQADHVRLGYDELSGRHHRSTVQFCWLYIYSMCMYYLHRM